MIQILVSMMESFRKKKKVKNIIQEMLVVTMRIMIYVKGEIKVKDQMMNLMITQMTDKETVIAVNAVYVWLMLKPIVMQYYRQN